MANGETIISQFRTDPITGEKIKQRLEIITKVNPLSPIISLEEIPDKASEVRIQNSLGEYLIRVYNVGDIISDQYFYVNHEQQKVYVHSSLMGQEVTTTFDGIGGQKISSQNIFTKVDDLGNITENLADVIEGGKQELEAVSILGGAVEVIGQLNTTIGVANATKTEITTKITEGETTIANIETAISNGDISTVKSDIVTINSSLSDITIQVKSFTCDDGQYVKGDGVHDDTSGIIKAIKYCYDNSINSTGWRMCLKLLFPSGIYRVTDTLISSTTNVRAGRFVFEGNGYQNTTIFFDTNVIDKKLFDNDGVFGFTTFEGLSFNGNNCGMFMNCVGGGSGNVQSFVFEKCLFTDWNKILFVIGGTMVSEVAFNHCKINGGTTTSIFFSLDNSQAVNWRFYSTDIESFMGICFDFIKGTSINFYQGSIIPINGIIFNINSLANVSSFGGGNNPLINFNGVRFELRELSFLIKQSSNFVNFIAIFDNCNMGGWNLSTLSTHYTLTLTDYSKCIFVNCYNFDNYKPKFSVINDSSFVKPSVVEFIGNCPDNDFVTNTNLNAISNTGGYPLYKYVDCGYNTTIKPLQGFYTTPSIGYMTTSKKIISLSATDDKLIMNNLVVDTPITTSIPISNVTLINLKLVVEKSWVGGYGGETFTINIYNGDRTKTFATDTLNSTDGINLVATEFGMYKCTSTDNIIIEFIPTSIWSPTFSAKIFLILEY